MTARCPAQQIGILRRGRCLPRCPLSACLRARHPRPRGLTSSTSLRLWPHLLRRPLRPLPTTTAALLVSRRHRRPTTRHLRPTSVPPSVATLLLLRPPHRTMYVYCRPNCEIALVDETQNFGPRRLDRRYSTSAAYRSSSTVPSGLEPSPLFAAPGASPAEVSHRSPPAVLSLTFEQTSHRKSRKKLSQGLCYVCGVEETPVGHALPLYSCRQRLRRDQEWRRGPAGLRTLCNACGLATSKLPNMGAAITAEEIIRNLERIGMARFRCTTFEVGTEAAMRVRAAFGGSGGTSSFSTGGFIPPSAAPQSESPVSSIASSTLSRERDMEAALSLQALSASSPSTSNSASSSSLYSSRRASMSPYTGFALPYTSGAGLGPSSTTALTSAERRMSRMSLEDADNLHDLPPSTLSGSQRMSIAHLTNAGPPPSTSPASSRRFSFSNGQGGDYGSSSGVVGGYVHPSYGAGGQGGGGMRPPTPSGRRFSMSYNH